MTLTDFLDTVTWHELMKDGSSHYKNKNGVELINLIDALCVLPHLALTGALRRATRNLQRLRDGEEISKVDIKKVIHELTFLYVSLR